jgi:hypothetical protein
VSADPPPPPNVRLLDCVLTDDSGDSLTGTAGRPPSAALAAAQSDGSLKLRFQLDTDPHSSAAELVRLVQGDDGSVHGGGCGST